MSYPAPSGGEAPPLDTHQQIKDKGRSPEKGDRRLLSVRAREWLLGANQLCRIHARLRRELLGPAAGGFRSVEGSPRVDAEPVNILEGPGGWPRFAPRL